MKPSLRILQVAGECSQYTFTFLYKYSITQPPHLSLLYRLPVIPTQQPPPNMHMSFAITALLLAFSSAQTYPECTRELVRSDDCAAVIDANACYNKFRWNAQTLTCIDGTDNAVKAKKVRHQIRQAYAHYC
jgi:hypothetical protein